MDLQRLITQLERYWARQGCAPLPPGWRGPAAVPACLAGPVAAPPGFPGGRYCFRVLLEPPPPGLRRAFLASLDAAGLDRAEHDLKWSAADRLPASCGWDLLLDGLPFASFQYGFPPGGRARAELLIGLERLAMAVQRKKKAGDLAWSGGLTYRDLHGGEGG